MITAVCAALVCSTAVQADTNGKPRVNRPASAKPWGLVDPSSEQRLNSASSTRRVMGGSGSGVQSGADHVMNQQCVDDGWGWPHASCSTTFHNITAPIAEGLLQAYEITADPAHLASAKAAGDFDLLSAWPVGGEARFGTFTAGFMYTLSQATGDSTYSDFAAVDLFDELTAGTYGDNNWDTAGFINAVEVARTGTWVNLRPWEFRTLGLMAATIGNAGQQALFNQGVLDGLNTLDNTAPGSVYSDLIGLSGGVEGLALNGTTSFTAIVSPLHSGINGISTLCDLADALAGYQNGDGSWYWHSGLGAPAEGDKDSQTTAYAVLALLAAQDAACGPYDTEIDLARGWLWSMQDTDGGFFSYPGGTHNVEVEGEVLTTMLPPDEVFVDDDYCDTCPNDGHQWGYDAYDNIQDAINAVGNSTINIAAGTYNESNIVIDTAVTIIGAGIGSTIIDPGGAIGFRPFADNITITDMTIENGSQAARFEMAGGTIDSTTFERVSFLNNSSRGIEIHNATTVTNLLISECHFESAGKIGLRVSSSGHIDGADFLDTTFLNNDIGIYEANDGGSSTMKNVLIKGCTFEGHTFSQGTSIFVEELQDAVIEENTFLNNRRDIQIFKWYQAAVAVSNVVIRNNTMTGTTDAHFAIFNDEHSSGQTEFDGVIFENNTCSGTFNSGKGPVFAGGHSGANLGGIGWDTVIVRNNSFSGVVSPAKAVRYFNPGVPPGEVLGGTQLLNTSGNHWGTTDPAALDALMDIASVTDFTPMIENGADQSGDPGYQPDLSTLIVHTLGAQTGAVGRLQEGMDLVSGSTINLAPGTYVEVGQLVIASDLTIIGDSSSNPVIMTDQDTGSSGDSRGWWLVNAGVTLVMENLVLDGTGFKVWQGIRSHGTLTATNCTFREIKFDASGPSYAGTAMTNFDAAGPGTLTATDCTFTEIGRIGIHAFGPAVITRCTYTGKGVGDFLDYFVCVGSFGASIGSAAITSCTVTGNRGVASSDGSTSAGMLVTTFFGAGTTATLTSNTLTDNTTGLVVGFDSADTSTVVANFNQFSGNDFGLINSAPSNQMDAENNWWGDADGPEHADDGNTDDVEIDLATCDTVSVDNMKNEAPGGSLGDTVSEGADFCPWLEGEGSLVLLGGSCQDDTSGEAGNQIEVELHMLDLSQAATGFQAFLEYPTASLSYRGDLSSYTSDPFSLHIQSIGTAEVAAGQIRLDGSDASGGDGGTKGNALLATLVFDVDVECSDITVDFDLTQAFDSELSFEGIPLTTGLEDTEAITLDDTDPVITVCPATTTVECDGAGNAADVAAWRATFAATDNCVGLTLTDDYAGLSDLCGATGISGTVTFTATDDCGNFSTCTSTFTVEDTALPVIGTPASNSTVECDGAGNGAEFAAWLASNGGASASDVCGGVTWSNNSVGLSDLCGETGAETVTFTATDDCGNFSTTIATFTIEDTVAPTIGSCPASFDINADAGGCDAEVTYTTPGATDDCDAAPAVTCDFPSGSTFSTGTTLVTCTAIDACTNSDAGSECSFSVTVNAVNDFDVDIELVGVFNNALPLTRCIHFVTDDCGNFADIELVFTDHDVTPATAIRSIDTVEVGCGDWTQLCVKDEQHTLIATATLTDVGTTYSATPVSLDGGDTDNDSDVDINDVTWYLVQFGDLSADGGCPWDGTTRDADFSNNGAVGTEDYTFLATNWLTSSSCACTIGLNGPDDPDPVLLTSMSAADVPADLAAWADLNADGWIDYKDVREFERLNGLPNDLSSVMEASEKDQR